MTNPTASSVDHDRVVVAVDVGGTMMKAGVLGPAGLHELRRVPTERERGPDAVLGTVHDVLAELLDRSDARGLEVATVGVAVPGVVDDAGVGRYSVTMGWRDLPIRQRLEEKLGRPVRVEHDVRAAAVAEASFGAATGPATSLFVPIGTGIAAAIVIDGIVVPGAAFQAGELGQVLVAAPLAGWCDDGDQLVTLERTSSARAIAERYARASGRPWERVTAGTVVAAMADGDANAVAVWAEAIDRLGAVLAAAIATLDPGVVVVGGGLSRAGTALVDPLTDAIGRFLPWRPVPPVELARFADDAGFVGCAISAWRTVTGLAVDDLAGALGSGWPVPGAAV